MLSEFCPFSGKGVMTDNIITNRTTDMIFFYLIGQNGLAVMC